MSGYIVNEDNIIYNVDKNGCEKDVDYWTLYSEKQEKRNNKVLKQMCDIWDSVEISLRVLICYGVDTDDIMKNISKLYFNFMRANKQQINDKKQRNISIRNRKKKLHKIKTTIHYI